jgi:hypothetical protein
MTALTVVALLLVTPAPPAAVPVATIQERAMASDLADLLSSPCSTTRRTPGVNGLDADAVLARFGEPRRRERFRLGDRDDEFRIGLRNVFPSGKPGSDETQIEEWTWERAGCRLTVWLHLQGKSRAVVDHLIYPADAEF